LVLFKPTYYGKVIKKAVEEYNNHNYDGQFTYWQKALKYTSKSELVFKGISKSLFKANNYEESLKYSKLANDRNGYSLALQFFRKQLMANYFGLFMTMCILLIVFLIILKSLRKYSKKGEKILGKIT
jgi:tetratricopeptide (TPR) repeat protein